MCAIAGIIGLNVSTECAEKMLKTMFRRGPDDQGMYRSRRCTLLHSRLAIIDPENGKQPMVLEWGGEQYVLVYNGELYNATELRQTLLELGHRFVSHCDTEIVLHAYAQWGQDCVKHFNGIFAFGIWEENGRRLFLARDRIGVKPLFYVKHEKGILFASEMKTILTYPGIPARLDEIGAAQLLLLGPGRLPGSGVFKGFRELEPGCRGYFEQGKFTWNRYWKLTDRIHTDSFDETVEHVRDLVVDAIERQMVSDVAIGTFLSGGLDSSIITSVCARKMQLQGGRLHTFSVDYKDNERYFSKNKFQPDADGTYIRIMEQMLDTDHKWTILSPEELVANLEEATAARDLPGMADVDFSLLAFCRQIRENVKVALSGECADEIFGGYPWYRDPEIRAIEGFPWAQNTSARTKLLSPDIRLDGNGFVMDAYITTCRESDILPENTQQERRMKELINLNFRWFMQTLLDRKDRMSMYHALEVRVPFCDYRIAEYLYAVPWEYKDYMGREKGLLRRAVRELLPEKVLYRKKSPYPKTFDPVYEQLIRAKVELLLSDGNAPVWALVHRDSFREYMELESPWPWYGQLMRRPQTMAYFLQLDYWLRHYDVEFVF